ncbi:DUF461 domain-containing protein [Streptomyces sp. NPDC021098]|uniref:DUF461 domain-containing protein n=1 Tax=unclassified Streptomyces TaxID=2593676 RepID=UPI00378E33D1
MSSSLRRGALAAAAIVVSVAPLSACGAGNDAQTLEVKPDNAATSVGDIKIQNATVVTQPDRTAKGPAVVTARIFNNGDRDETITAVTLPDAKATAKLHPAKGAAKGASKIVVPAGGSVALGGAGNASAVVPDGREAARDGDAQRIVFDLSSTGNVPITAFVVPATSYFKGWGPSELPTPAPSATRGGTPSGGPSAKPGDQTPGGKPSDAASGSASNKPGSGQNNGVASGEPTPNGQH